MLSKLSQFLIPAVFIFGLVLVFQFLNADPFTIHLESILNAPSSAYWLGTDELGRDVLPRLIDGVKVSLTVGVSVLLLAGTIGVVIGVVSGWYGGIVDTVLMRITDVFLSFPGVLIAICFAALTEPDVKNVIFALGLMGWVSFARLARVQTLSIKNLEYMQAAHLGGVGTVRMLSHYVLPNIAAPLIVESIFTIAGAMLSEAGLSFLGIGIQPPDASLGAMLREGARYMLMAPHLVVVPGVTLMLLVFSLNLAGDKIRDRLDVKC
tara:strand:- start:17959 stop:18753 length:795 start_codon:yes stop_codon:yes gene_type:complete